MQGVKLPKLKAMCVTYACNILIYVCVMLRMCVILHTVLYDVCNLYRVIVTPRIKHGQDKREGRHLLFMQGFPFFLAYHLSNDLVSC